MGLVTGVAVTLVLGEGLFGETGESDTVANAALEAVPSQGVAPHAAEPVAVAPRLPTAPPVNLQPTAAEPAVPAAAAPEPAQAAEPVPAAAAEPARAAAAYRAAERCSGSR
jgi:hypothetical protein